MMKCEIEISSDPLWTKIESPKVVYFAGTGDGRDGEGGENWGESLGEKLS